MAKRPPVLLVEPVHPERVVAADLIVRADEALCRAKHQGRNRVETWLAAARDDAAA